jgi:hypothetical protein
MTRLAFTGFRPMPGSASSAARSRPNGSPRHSTPSQPAYRQTRPFAALAEGRAIIELTGGLQLRRVRVMGEHRIEFTGFTEPMRERLRAYGLFSEIIAWKLRFFVPIVSVTPGAAPVGADGEAHSETGEAILARLIERYPLVRVCARAVD